MARTFTARTMIELQAKIYAAHGWTRKAGESRASRIKALYDLSIDPKRSLFVAKRKEG